MLEDLLDPDHYSLPEIGERAGFTRQVYKYYLAKSSGIPMTQYAGILTNSWLP